MVVSIWFPAGSPMPTTVLLSYCLNNWISLGGRNDHMASFPLLTPEAGQKCSVIIDCNASHYRLCSCFNSVVSGLFHEKTGVLATKKGSTHTDPHLFTHSQKCCRDWQHSSHSVHRFTSDSSAQRGKPGGDSCSHWLQWDCLTPTVTKADRKPNSQQFCAQLLGTQALIHASCQPIAQTDLARPKNFSAPCLKIVPQIHFSLDLFFFHVILQFEPAHTARDN